MFSLSFTIFKKIVSISLLAKQNNPSPKVHGVDFISKRYSNGMKYLQSKVLESK